MVTGIAVRNGEVDRVTTDKGEIRTAIVVDAAGAWTRLVAKMAGADAATVATRHQLFITDPIKGAETDQPITRITTPTSMFGPTRAA